MPLSVHQSAQGHYFTMFVPPYQGIKIAPLQVLVTYEICRSVCGAEWL